jgi:hypothetical protein
VTPGRRLLGPIQPPLPHSKSTGNVNEPPTERQVSIDEAILESRMSRSEIELLNQVQKEAVQNHTRFRSRYGNPPSGLGSPLSEIENGSAAHHSRRSVPRTEISPSGSMTKSQERTSDASKSHDGTIDTNTINPKHVSYDAHHTYPANNIQVYFAQDVSYWAGRYMTVRDRLRGEAMELSLRRVSSGSDCSEAGSGLSYEAREAQHMLSAIDELRSSCKTAKASASFDVFEHQLRRNTGRSPLASSPSVQSVSDTSSVSTTVQIKANVKTTTTRTENLETIKAKARPTVPSTMARTKQQPPLPNIFGRLAMTKSKTTGNISRLAVDSVSSGRSAQAAGSSALWHHRRKSSIQSVALGAPATLSSETAQSARLIPRPSAVHTRKSSAVTVSSTASTKSSFAAGNADSERPDARHQSTSLRTVDRREQLSPGVGVSSTEDDHALAPLRPPVSLKSPLSAQNRPVMVNDERHVKSRRSKHRRSSGEAIKGLWSAGVEHVRKMGRRVGGSESWLVNDDESAAVSGSGRR